MAFKTDRCAAVMGGFKSRGRKTAIPPLTSLRAGAARGPAPEAKSPPAGESDDGSGDPWRATLGFVLGVVSAGRLSIWGFSEVQHRFLCECVRGPGQVPWGAKGGEGDRGSEELRVRGPAWWD